MITIYYDELPCDPYKVEIKKADFVGETARAKWDQVQITFGLYNRQWKAQYPMSPSIMRFTLENALSIADNNLVWFYAEQVNWIGEGISDEWNNAIKGAMNAVTGND